MKEIRDDIIEKILVYFYHNDPQVYLIHDRIEIDDIDQSDVKRYIPILQEAGYLHGFFVDVGSDSGKYAIGGLSEIGREAVRQHYLGNKISLFKKY